MVLLPLDVASAAPPPALRQALQQQHPPPEPLPPELEARLRRQRAQAYGRNVREGLAAWHAKHSSRREAKLAAQREVWEAQRAARLARLAEKQAQQQQPPLSRAAVAESGPPCKPVMASTAAVGNGAAQENASPPDLLRAVQQLDSKLARAGSASLQPKPPPAGLPSRLTPSRAASPQRGSSPRRRQEAARPAASARRSALGGRLPSRQQAAAPSPAVRADAAAWPVQEGFAAAAGPADGEHPVPSDPLEALLASLLEAEGSGDPFSVINLFIAEQLELQQQQEDQRQRRRQQQGRQQVSPQRWQQAGAAPQRDAAAPAGAAGRQNLASSAEAAEGALAAGGCGSGLRRAHSAAATLMPNQPLPQPGAAQAAPEATPAAGGALRPPSAVPNGENVSANVRHRRSGSVVLPPDFSLSAELLPAGPSALQLSATASAAAGEAAAAPAAEQHAADSAAAGQRFPASMRQAEGRLPIPEAPLPEEEAGPLEAEGSRHLYVQQWLQRSAAELEAGGPASSTAGTEAAGQAGEEASEAGQAAAEDLLLSSSLSSVAQTVHARGPAAGSPSAFAAPARQAQLQEASSEAEALAGRSGVGLPSYAAAAAQAVLGVSAQLSDLSASSYSAPAVASIRRPGAPVPPGSSTETGRASGQGVAAQAPAQPRQAAQQGTAGLHLAPAANGALGKAPARLAASSPGSSLPGAAAPAGVGPEEEGLSDAELVAALSFGQLEAMAGPGGDVTARSGGAAAERQLGGHAAGASQQPAQQPARQQAAAVAASESWASSVPGYGLGSEGSPSPASSLAESAEEVAEGEEQEEEAAGAEHPAAAQMQGAARPSRTHGSEAGSSDFGSNVEFSYGEQYGTPRRDVSAAQQGQLAQRGAASAAAGRAAGAAFASPGATPRPSSPAELLEQASLLRQGQQAALSPRLLPQQQQGGALPRPRSPHHAALDERYPGSPPASPGNLHRPMPSSGSRPMSPASLVCSSRRGSGDGCTASRQASADGGSSSVGTASRPGSPPAVLPGELSAAAGAVPADASVLSASASASSMASRSEGPKEMEEAEVASPPHAVTRFAALPDQAGTLSPPADSLAGGGAADAAVAQSPPGTPVLVSPTAGGESCPGSAHVQDDTVVQTEEHVGSYLAEVMAYFWAERAEAFAAGQVPPLGLDGYLAIERRRPPCGDPQHIFNKLLFDAVDEALVAHYSQALASYTGRLNPRMALLSRERIEQNVVQRVMRWAALGAPRLAAGGGSGGGAGGAGGFPSSQVLAEDAAEDERTLLQLEGALLAELASAAADGDAEDGGMAAAEAEAA